MLNEYSFDSIYIRHAIDESPDDKYFTMHIHDQCEIYYFLSGQVEYLVEGSRYPLKEKSLMIMRPAESHKARITGCARYERYAVNFPLSIAREIDPQGLLTKAFTDRELGEGNLCPTENLDMKLVSRLFSQMITADDSERQLTIKVNLITLLHMIYNASKSTHRTGFSKQTPDAKIVSYVNTHLFEDINLPKLASQFFLSTSQFSRVFRQATGAAPWEYITKKRLTKAKEMISSGKSAANTARDCGFKDYSSFYRAYKKHFGQSPSEKAQQ